MSEQTTPEATTHTHRFDYNVIPGDGYCRGCDTKESTLTEAESTTDAPVEATTPGTIPPARKRGPLDACECQNWEIGETVDGEDGDEPEVTIFTTGCDKQTKRLFAQGHDAKLKSLLIKAGVEGLEVRWGRRTGVLVTTDYEGAARRFGFETQVIDGVRNRLDKLARSKKAIPAAPKTVGAEVVEGSEEGDTPRVRDESAADYQRELAGNLGLIPEAPADQDGWSSDEQAGELLDEATDEVITSGVETVKAKIGRWEYEGVVAADGSFHYKSANGEDKVADAGKWTPAE